MFTSFCGCFRNNWSSVLLCKIPFINSGLQWVHLKDVQMSTSVCVSEDLSLTLGIWLGFVLFKHHSWVESGALWHPMTLMSPSVLYSVSWIGRIPRHRTDSTSDLKPLQTLRASVQVAAATTTHACVHSYSWAT